MLCSPGGRYCEADIRLLQRMVMVGPHLPVDYTSAADRSAERQCWEIIVWVAISRLQR